MSAPVFDVRQVGAIGSCVGFSIFARLTGRGPVKAQQGEVWHQGSSSDAIFDRALWLREKRQTVFVTQIAAGLTVPLRNVLRSNRHRNDVSQTLRSGYTPSPLPGKLRRSLGVGAQFEFVGKPCEVATLCSFANRPTVRCSSRWPGMAPRYKRMGLWRAALGARKLERLRNAWGTYKRAKGEPT